MSRRSLRHAHVALAVATLTSFVLLLLRRDEVIGLYLDDAWYVMLAQALATGHGLTLINAPVAGVLPLYPPGFPFLLSLIVRWAPPFPESVAWLKLPSLVAVPALAWVAFTLLRHDPRPRQMLGAHAGLAIALGVAVATAFHPALGFFAASTLMSEPVFAVIQLAAVLAVERAVAAPSRAAGLRRAAWAGGLVAATVLVRSIALPLVPIGALWLARHRSSRRAAAVYVAVAVLALGPWTVYSRLHAPTPEQDAIVNDQITIPYATHFFLKLAGYRESGWAGWSDLPGRVIGNLRTVALSSIGSLAAYPLGRSVEPGVWRTTALTQTVSAVVAGLCCLGLASLLRRGPRLVDLHILATLGVLLIFPFDATRYLQPLQPVFVFYAALGVAALLRSLRFTPAASGRAAWGFTTLVATGALAGSLSPLLPVDASLPLAQRYGWRDSYAENVAHLQGAARLLPDDAVVATHNPPLVHLFTGRKTVGYWAPETDSARWRAAGAKWWLDCWYSGQKYPDLSNSGRRPLLVSPFLRHGLYRLDLDDTPPTAPGAARHDPGADR